MIWFLITYLGFILLAIMPFFVKKENKKDIDQTKNGFSIVIVFKDEHENLKNLLKQLNNLQYDNILYEVILIEDSKQKTFICPDANFKIIHIALNSVLGSPKKEGITKAIEMAQFPWIVVTDADVSIQPQWLNGYNNLINQHPEKRLWCGTVFIKKDKGWINQYQQCDFLSLQWSTLSAFFYKQPLMCNGANMCYQKTLFRDLNGFDSTMHIASGDDVFLMFKTWSKQNKWVGYSDSKGLSVETHAVKTLDHLINQRVRWSSKLKVYNKKFPVIVGLIVLVGHLFWLGSLLLFLMTFHLKFLVFLILKSLLDLALLYTASQHWNIKPKGMFISLIIHPFIQTYVVMRSFVGSYEWKGRQYKIN